MIVALFCLCPKSTPAASQSSVATGPGADPDQACASCHGEIYEHYRQTPMAQASGPAQDGLLQGSFHHDSSGVEYKVFLRDGEGWMSYARESSGLRGERKLAYFIGSGHRGRTYLYEEQGLWFEAPINYYSKKAIWDMAPNYGSTRHMPDGLPVDPNCLHCHATDVQPSLPTARNRFADVPFHQDGIGCAACHGAAIQHLAQSGKGPMLDLAKLSAARRDSICLQCHLEGDAAIYHAGKSLADFRPGDDLADYVTYFVKAGAEAGGGRAASQYEALLRSRCKIASGDKLTCTTCHDPHSVPSEPERVSYYRARCLNCHTGQAMATQHHPEQQDCAICHMPTRATTDISHEQSTDHDIQRFPGKTRLADLTDAAYRLVAVGNAPAGDRELGLAYAQAATQGNQQARPKALQLLEKAEAADADDPELHAQLGLVEQLGGNRAAAQREYDRALAEDPNNLTALGNSAVLDASSGRAQQAVELLQRVVRNDPSQVSASLNLAFIECVAGNKRDALHVLTAVQQFSPDDPALRNFLDHGVYAGQHCALGEPIAKK